MTALDAPMMGDGCRAELFEERHRDALRAACAEDGDIWQIYANNFGPGGFDSSIDLYTSSKRNRTFVLFDGDELVGMSSFLGIDLGRQVLEIGGTYHRPRFRGTGFNRRVKDMMLRRAFDCGFRRVEFRVDERNQRSQAAMTKLGAAIIAAHRRAEAVDHSSPRSCATWSLRSSRSMWLPSSKLSSARNFSRAAYFIRTRPATSRWR